MWLDASQAPHGLPQPGIAPQNCAKPETSVPLQESHVWPAAAEAAMVAAALPKQPTVQHCELGLKKKSWCWSAVIWYNQLPLDLRSEVKISTFKTRLKKWVTMNVDI